MKRFLASVGTARLLGKRNGELYHIANVKTLTESALRFSAEAEEIRAGQGAQLKSRFFHSSKIEISLTDIMWDMDYIGLLIGGDVSSSIAAHNGLTSENVEDAPAVVTLSNKAVIVGNSCGLNHAMVWIKEIGCDVNTESDCVEVSQNKQGEYTNQIKIPEQFQGKNICLQYFIEMPQVRTMDIGARFLPKETVLILTTNLYAGSYDKIANGKPVGNITVKIPRFQLDGNFDISMAMSSVASVQLSGVALTADIGNCSGAGVYAEIIEVNEYTTAATGLLYLEVDPDTQTAGDFPVVYGYYKDGHISVIDPDDYDIDPPVDRLVGLIGNTIYTVTVGNISTTFKAIMPSAYFKGNPIVFDSNNSSTVLTLRGYGQGTQLDIIGNPNTRLISGTTTVNIIGDSSGTYRVESERPMVIEAGDTTVVIYG